jgi:hypothetical protein
MLNILKWFTDKMEEFRLKCILLSKEVEHFDIISLNKATGVRLEAGDEFPLSAFRT